MTAEEPLNLRCSAAGNTTAVILVVKKFLSIMNKLNEIRMKILNIDKFV